VTVTISDYIGILRLRWRVISACVLLGLVAALISAPNTNADTRSAGQYSATATLVSTTSDPVTRTQELALAKALAETPAVAAQVAKKVPGGGDPQSVASAVEVSPNSDAGLLSVTAMDPSPERAVAIASQFAAQATSALARTKSLTTDAQRSAFESEIAKIQGQLNPPEGSSPSAAEKAALESRLKQLQQSLNSLEGTIATPFTAYGSVVAVPIASPGRFVGPSGLGPRLLIGVLLGAILGMGLALLLERVDTRLRTRSAVQIAFRLPVVGEIPRLRKRDRRGDVVLAVERPESAAAEAYRSLRSAVLHLPSGKVPSRPGELHEPASADGGKQRAPTVVLVTSPRPGDGKTTTVVNLAACMAETGRTVIVLDCDLRNPAAQRYLRPATPQGLSDLLVVDVDHELERALQGSRIVDMDLERILQETRIPGVQIATAGTAVHHPAALLSRLGSIVRSARDHADIVIVDAPPLLGASDAIDLIPDVDTVLVVCQAGTTTAEYAERASDALARIQARVTGVALIATGGTFGGGDRTSGTVSGWRRAATWLLTGSGRSRDWRQPGGEGAVDPSHDIIPGMQHAETIPPRDEREQPADPDEPTRYIRPEERPDIHLPSGDDPWIAERYPWSSGRRPDDDGRPRR
jgi:Mrp family chromosome partitioning ATPase